MKIEKIRWPFSALLALMVVACGGDAPPPQPPEPEEADGDLALEHVVSLGGADAPYSLGLQPLLTVDSRGRIAARARGERETVVFDRHGRLLRTLGTGDQGAPGSFRQAVLDVQFGPGDSLFVRSVGSVSVFDADLDFARSVPLAIGGALRRLVVLPDSRMLLHGHISYPHVIEEPFHVLSPTGEVETSFGNAEVATYVYTASPPGAWEREGWGPFARQVVGTAGTGGPDSVATPGGARMRPWDQTQEGLWLFANYRTGVESEQDMATWARAIERMRNPPEATTMEELRASSITMKAALDSVTEIVDRIDGTALTLVDPESGEEIASGRLNRRLEPIRGTGLAWSRREDRFGEYTYDIWKIVVR